MTIYSLTPSCPGMVLDASGWCGVAEWFRSVARPGFWTIIVTVGGQCLMAPAVVDDFGTLVPVERLR